MSVMNPSQKSLLPSMEFMDGKGHLIQTWQTQLFTQVENYLLSHHVTSRPGGCSAMRTTLTILQKQKLLTERDRRRQNGLNTTHRVLSDWAKNEFNLPNAPSKAALSRMVSTSDELLSHKGAQLVKMKRQVKGRAHVLETELFSWISEQQTKNKSPSGLSIQQKARQIAILINERACTPSERITLTFSEGWLDNFKRRWGFRLSRSQIESPPPSICPAEEPFANALPRLQRLISEYSLSDVFNCDEGTLFCCMAPDNTISKTENEKERITFMPCSNADATEKLDIMLVASAKKTAVKHAFDYHANINAGMTRYLFFNWLHRFQSYVSKTPQRNVLLLLDRCTAHGTSSNLPSLPNVCIEFLPPPVRPGPNCTTNQRVQPMDAGIIAALKIRYKRFHMENALDNVDMDSQDVYRVDVWTAMKWLTKAWKEMPESVIRNGWKHTRLLAVDTDAPAAMTPDAPLEPKILADLEGQVAQLVPPRHRLSISQVLNLEGDDEEESSQVMNDEEIASAVLGTEDNGENGESDEVPAVPSLDTVLPPVDEQLRALAVTKQVAESAGLDVDASLFMTHMRQLQSRVRKQKARGMSCLYQV